MLAGSPVSVQSGRKGDFVSLFIGERKRPPLLALAMMGKENFFIVDKCQGHGCQDSYISIKMVVSARDDRDHSGKKFGKAQESAWNRP